MIKACSYEHKKPTNIIKVNIIVQDMVREESSHHQGWAQEWTKGGVGIFFT